MTAEADLEPFQRAVEAHDGVATLTGVDGFARNLDDVLDLPAVGVDIPIEGVSLADSPVDLEPSPAALESAKTGITPAGFGIATLGTVFLESRSAGDEPVSLFPERHVAVLAASDIVSDLEAAFERLARAFTGGTVSGVLASGPSATADMGATVQGVHGPSEVHVIVVTDR